MGLWNNIFNTASDHTFLKVIEWREDGSPKIVHKHPTRDAVITNGSKLIVAEGQMALFMQEGQFSAPFGPGTYDLATRTSPIWSFFETIKYGLNQPYKGDIFFISTRNFLDQKWGTPGPIPMEDERFGIVNIKAFGSFAFRVNTPDQFIREIVGNQGAYTSSEIGKYLKRKLSSYFIDTLGDAKIPILKLAAQYADIGDAMRDRMSPKFEKDYGVKLTDFIVERVSMPEKVMEQIDNFSSVSMFGDKIGALNQMKMGNAIENMSTRPGGSNTMLDAGMGLAMGNMMGNMMGGGVGGQQAHAAPPPPPSAPTFHYNGSAGSGQFSAQDIAQKISSNRNGNHQIWAAGWPSWRAWNTVPEIANLVPPAPAAPPPTDEVFYYNGPSGQSQLPVSEIVAKVKAAPDAEHKVWKQGFDGWKDVASVPAIQIALNSGPPPIAPAGGPPPI
ncbi:MAG: SPFH domain-containing protein [Myxococcota bacterium]|nr:SPFH domain-containing protein [Myxococcota bacterium]